MKNIVTKNQQEGQKSYQMKQGNDNINEPHQR